MCECVSNKQTIFNNPNVYISGTQLANTRARSLRSPTPYLGCPPPSLSVCPYCPIKIPEPSFPGQALPYSDTTTHSPSLSPTQGQHVFTWCGVRSGYWLAERGAKLGFRHAKQPWHFLPGQRAAKTNRVRCVIMTIGFRLKTKHWYYVCVCVCVCAPDTFCQH